MIYIVYGTRAELIKFSSLIRELKRRKASFRTIDTGQHDNNKLLRSLRLPKPYKHLGKSLRDRWSKLEASFATYPIASLLALVWGAGVFIKLSRILSDGDVIVTHGNTMSVPLTIYSTRLGKKDFTSKADSNRKYKLVHLESGFRANTRDARLLDIIYKFADKKSDILFTPFHSSARNLASGDIRGKVIISGDIMGDVVRDTLKMRHKISIQRGRYILVSITRSIVNRHDAKQILHAIRDSPMKMIVIMNPVIEERVLKFGLSRLLESEKIKVLRPVPYPDFIQLVRGSAGVITDSTGVEEECAVLGKPCIVTNSFLQIPEFEKTGVVRKTGCNYIGIIKNIKKIHDGRWKVNKSKEAKSSKSPTSLIADYIDDLETRK